MCKSRYAALTGCYWFSAHVQIRMRILHTRKLVWYCQLWASVILCMLRRVESTIAWLRIPGWQVGIGQDQIKQKMGGDALSLSNPPPSTHTQIKKKYIMVMSAKQASLQNNQSKRWSCREASDWGCSHQSRYESVNILSWCMPPPAFFFFFFC